MSTAEKRKILDYIKKTGYPLEVDVATWLIDDGWIIFPQFSYFDEQSKRIRDIDMVAFHPEPSMAVPFSPAMILECKKSEKPWVFYSAPRIQAKDLEQLPEFDFKKGFFIGKKKIGFNLRLVLSVLARMLSAFPPSIDWGKYKDVTSPAFARIKDLHFLSPDLPIAHSCHVAFLDTKEDVPDDYHKAVYQIRGAYFEVRKQLPFSIFFATIVLKGKSFLYKKDDVREELEHCDHVLTSTSWLTKTQTEESPPRYPLPPVIVDVVRDSYFPDYLKLLKKDFGILRNIFRKINEVVSNEQETKD